MPKYKITVEYDGTELCGWQKQIEQTSVQGLLEEAIFQMTQERVETVASGRTDSGVHALGQVVHFQLEKDFSEEKIRNGINFYMPGKPVVVVAAQKVSDEFHARFDAKKRYYKYVILNRQSPAVVERNRVWHVPQQLDIEKMKQAASHLIGHHDFTSFRSTECQAKNPNRTLDEIRIEEHSNEAGRYIVLYFSALSFLHHMVRNITGTLAQVGMGKISPDEIPNILKAKDRTKAGVQAPAAGLYFLKTDY